MEEKKEAVSRIVFAGKLVVKGNSRAVVIPAGYIEEMDLETGEMVQITIERLPRE